MKEQKMAQRIEKPAKEEKLASKEKKPSSKPTYKQLKDLENLEISIQKMESERDQVINRMNSGNESPESLNSLSVTYNNLVQSIDEKTLLWMELGEIIESTKG
jgi:ATP-binding cassette subfamily F protein uup